MTSTPTEAQVRDFLQVVRADTHDQRLCRFLPLANRCPGTANFVRRLRTEGDGMTNTEVVQKALGAVRGGDLQAARTVVTDDFVWRIPGRSSIAGDARGVEGWSEKLTRLLGAGLQPTLLDMLEGEERVVALQHNTAQSGRHTLDVSVVNVFTLSDGKVCRLDTYFGDQEAADAFWTAALP